MSGRMRTSRSLLRGVRLSLGRVVKFVVWWLLGALVLGATIAIIPGISSDSAWGTLLAALIVAVVGAVLRPVLTAFALALSWVGVFLLGLFAQARVSPGIHVNSFWDAFWASWIYAIFAAIVDWLFSVDEEQAFLAHVLRRAGKGIKLAGADPTLGDAVPGVVFVQLDGVSAPVLRMGLMAGNLPVLSRWIRDGGHRLPDCCTAARRTCPRSAGTRRTAVGWSSPTAPTTPLSSSRGCPTVGGCSPTTARASATCSPATPPPAC
jgi:uncharacterized membrane protein YvlD (DUF360 family)